MLPMDACFNVTEKRCKLMGMPGERCKEPLTTERSRVRGYAAALVAVGVASVMRLALDPILGDRLPYVTYFAGVAFAAWVGGIGPGVFAVALSSVVADYLFIPPRLGLAMLSGQARDVVAVTAFLFTNLILLIITEGMRRAQWRARESERKHRELSAELEIRVAERTRELRETLGELDAFSYTVAHDLRAPLRSISGYAELLLESGENRTDEGRTYAERIKRSAVRLDQLTRDVLNYSRVSREKLELKPVNTEQLVRDLVEDNAHLSDRRSHIEIRSPLLPVLGHEPLLIQAMSNLLVNACKFVAEGTKPRVVVGSEAVDGQVRLSVQDNGIGIAPQDQKRLFTIFGRLDTTERFEGTGIASR